MKTRIGIVGYGNLGRGAELAVREAGDMELAAVFTRRSPENVSILTPDVPVLSVDELKNWTDKIDVLILCGGSATDLPVQTPKYAKLFNVIDSFDTHAKIPEHFAHVDAAAKEGGHVAMISVGWDPGLFSLNRVYANAGRKGLYLLGQGCQSGTFGRCPPHKGCKECKAVYDSDGKGS